MVANCSQATTYTSNVLRHGPQRSVELLYLVHTAGLRGRLMKAMSKKLPGMALSMRKAMSMLLASWVFLEKETTRLIIDTG